MCKKRQNFTISLNSISNFRSLNFNDSTPPLSWSHEYSLPLTYESTVALALSDSSTTAAPQLLITATVLSP